MRLITLAIIGIFATTACQAQTWAETLVEAELTQIAGYIRSGDLNGLSFKLGYYGAIENVCPSYGYELHPEIVGFASIYKKIFHEEGTSNEMHQYARLGVKEFSDRVRNHYNGPSCEIALGEGLVTEISMWWLKKWFL